MEESKKEFMNVAEAEEFCRHNPLESGYYVFEHLKDGSKVRVFAIQDAFDLDAFDIPDDVREQELREPNGEKITKW